MVQTVQKIQALSLSDYFQAVVAAMIPVYKYNGLSLSQETIAKSVMQQALLDYTRGRHGQYESFSESLAAYLDRVREQTASSLLITRR